jgi:sugar phosphate isomerase/epimerase
VLSRRRFFGACAGGVAAAYAAPAPRLGIYLHEFGRDLAATFREVAARGYRDVELGGLRERPPAELRKLLAAAGLTCKSACWPMWVNDADSQDTLDAAVELGLEYIVTPDPSRMGKEWFEPARGSLTLNDWRWNADWFNHVGGLAQKNNVQFVYRTQATDFAPLADSTGFHELWLRTEPTRVKFELDCSATPPAAFLEKYGSRTVLLHIAKESDWPTIRDIAGDRQCFLVR